MQHDLNKLRDWLDSNRLSLNVSKTKCMIFGVKPYTDHVALKIDGSEIQLVNDFKFLGIWFNNQLTFETHADKLLNKLRYHLYILKNTVKLLNVSSRKSFFHAFVMSIVRYGLIVWWPHIKSDQKVKINNIISKCRSLCSIRNECINPETYFNIDMLQMYF